MEQKMNQGLTLIVPKHWKDLAATKKNTPEPLIDIKLARQGWVKQAALRLAL